MATTSYTIRCLSPVHVGTGATLSKFDGAYAAGRWHLVDLDRVFAQGVDGEELAQAMSVAKFSWAEWLRGRRFTVEQVALYSLPCPQDPGDVAIREGVKNVYLQPYLPGTTLKGAIRTAILWHLLRQDARAKEFTRRYLLLATFAKDIRSELHQIARGNRDLEQDPNRQRDAIGRALEEDDLEEREALLQTLYSAMGKDLQQARKGNRRECLRMRDFEDLGKDKRLLALPVERYVFGADPNHDLLRTVQVQDSAPTALSNMEVGLVWTYTLRQNQLVPKRESEGEYKSFAELLKADSELTTAIRIDETLFSQQAERELRFAGAKQQAVRQLAQVCNSYAQTLIQHEKAFFTKYQLAPLRDFYGRLENVLRNAPRGAFLLNIGWGGGWEAKTVGDIVREVLQDNEYADFEELRERFQLGANPRTKRIDTSFPFPHTRLIAYRNGAPYSSLGWVLLKPSSSKPTLHPLAP